MLELTERAICHHETEHHLGPASESPGRLAPAPAIQALAGEILGIVMRYRRAAPESRECTPGVCGACLAPHLARVIAAIERLEPVTFILPAFPGKSPNPAKVLGARPDMAERQSLGFLSALCRRIRDIYAPGARIVLCSDGRVFNDVVGIPDHDITGYQHELRELVAELSAGSLSTFNLDEVFGGCDFGEMRMRLMGGYARPIESLRAEVKEGGDALLLYRGITRFLVEDAKRPGLSISNTALQKECRQRAYHVIQRSRAWDALLAERFPDAVRLSIHPQPCGSRKIGIHLMETADAWLTPWHCVAVEIRGRYRLMKRSHAELLNAGLVHREGRPSHYVLADLPEQEARR